nr:DUF3626 domain-containing protein [Streptomyces sp. MJP52]
MLGAAHERPADGTLNFPHKPVGGASQFGSAHFRLTVRTLSRSTSCRPGLGEHPATDAGTHRTRTPRSEAAAETEEHAGLGTAQRGIPPGTGTPLAGSHDDHAAAVTPAAPARVVSAVRRSGPFPDSWEHGDARNARIFSTDSDCLLFLVVRLDLDPGAAVPPADALTGSEQVQSTGPLLQVGRHTDMTGRPLTKLLVTMTPASSWS